jgi:hypothetical protein
VGVASADDEEELEGEELDSVVVPPVEHAAREKARAPAAATPRVVFMYLRMVSILCSCVGRMSRWIVLGDVRGSGPCPKRIGVVTYPLYCAPLILRNGGAGHTKRPRIPGFAAISRAGCVASVG